MKTGCIIQARMTSSRLPGKVLMDICGKSALERVIERVRGSKKIQDIVVATTVNSKDDCIIQLCEKLGCEYYRGSEDDVLTRVLEAARAFEVDVIVEITADCVLIDWNHIDAIVNLFFSGDYDHVSNIIEDEQWPRTFPRGYDVRVFSREALERTNKEVDNPIDRSHVSTWMYRNPKGKLGYKYTNYSAPNGQNRSDLEITLDTLEDLELIRWIYGFESQGYNLKLDCQDVINLLDTYPHMYQKVSKVTRKDYFQELEAAYKYLNELDNRTISGSPTKPEVPVGIVNAVKNNNKGSEKKNEKPRSKSGSKRSKPKKKI